jgi:hypothetical protein
MDAQSALGKKYEAQYAFEKTYWAEMSVGTYFANIFYQPTYKDASRIARECEVMTPAMRNWRYAVDKEKKGEGLGWAKAEFGDSGWKPTDVCEETWADLGIPDYFGTVWYRTSVKIGDVPSVKKAYVWLSCTDGSARVFVNGVEARYVDPKGGGAKEFNGYCVPASFDATASLKPNAENQITIMATRTFINELGTGGLLGPVVVYRDR